MVDPRRPKRQQRPLPIKISPPRISRSQSLFISPPRDGEPSPDTSVSSASPPPRLHDSDEKDYRDDLLIPPEPGSPLPENGQRRRGSSLMFPNPEIVSPKKSSKKVSFC